MNKGKLKKIIMFITFLISVNYIVLGTNYYVSTSIGNDLYDGKTQSTPWKTLAKVSGYSTFKAGDSILLKRAETWREILYFPGSGTVSSYITLSGYGSGVKPRIMGSYTSTWSLSSGNIWISDNIFENPRASFPADAYFVKTDGTVQHGVYKTGTSLLTTEFNWTWSGNKIYVYSTTDPDTKYTGIEIPQRRACIDTKNKQYININGIDLFYGQFQGISYDWSYDQREMFNMTIENCEIAHIGGDITNLSNEEGYGIDVGYTNMIIRHCTIHDCGRRSISLHIYGSGFTVKNILIEDNLFYNGHHTTGPDLSVGSGYTASIDGVIIRRNIISDNPTASGWSEGLFLQNYLYSGTTTFLRNVYIYSNLFISPIGNSINMEGTQSVFIYNNTFYNHNVTNNSRAHVWVDNNNASVKIKNNIFYTTSTNDIGGGELFIRSGQTLANVDANYNLYYRINNYLRIVEKESSGTYHMNDISLIRSSLGLEMNSPTPSDPQFASSSDYHLQTGSPAIGKGLYIPEVISDFEGNSFGNVPNIGAYSSSGIIGIEEIFDGKIVIYPVPVNNNLCITYDNNFNPTIIEIYDIMGKKVINEQISEGENPYNLSLNLHSGLYILKLINNAHQSVSSKIIVE